MNKKIAFINDEFIEEEKACLHISDLSIQRGYGVFDYCRTNDDIPVYLDDHIRRFFHSAAIMHLQVPVTENEIKSIILQLISKNNMSASGIRMLLTGGYSPDSFEIIQPNLIILQHALVLPPRRATDKGIKVITHEYIREFPEAKTINYSMGIWLQQKIKHNLAIDVLYHHQGEVSEFPRSNFFIVTKDNVVATPNKNILYGITRMKVLQLAKKAFTVEERVVTIQDIREAKEAFMTSTTKRILPIVEVDNSMIGNGLPGSVSNYLDHALQDVEKEKVF